MYLLTEGTQHWVQYTVTAAIPCSEAGLIVVTIRWMLQAVCFAERSP